jgi:hypothetical protein
MLSLITSVVGIVASESNKKFPDFESFKTDLLNPNNRSFHNETCKNAEKKYYSLDLASAVQLVMIVPAMYQTLPSKTAFKDVVGMVSCYHATDGLMIQLHRAENEKEKQNQIVDDFKDTYEKCMALGKSVFEQSK